MSEVTVVIPVHDPNGLEEKRLLRAIKSIAIQSNPPNMVSIASNHEIFYIDEITQVAAKRFRFEHFINATNGAADNLNFLLEQTTTKFSKILFQDDFLKSRSALMAIENSLERSQKKWLIHGFDHFFEDSNLTDREQIPKFTRNLRRGINKIGAPSVIAFRNGSIPKFNSEMVYMFDCEWYLQMQHMFGNPTIIRDPLVTIGIHSNQATVWAREFLKKEVNLTRKLHPISAVKRRCKNCGSWVNE